MKRETGEEAAVGTADGPRRRRGPAPHVSRRLRSTEEVGVRGPRRLQCKGRRWRPRSRDVRRGGGRGAGKNVVGSIRDSPGQEKEGIRPRTRGKKTALCCRSREEVRQRRYRRGGTVGGSREMAGTLRGSDSLELQFLGFSSCVRTKDVINPTPRFGGSEEDPSEDPVRSLR